MFNLAQMLLLWVIAENWTAIPMDFRAHTVRGFNSAYGVFLDNGFKTLRAYWINGALQCRTVHLTNVMRYETMGIPLQFINDVFTEKHHTLGKRELRITRTRKESALTRNEYIYLYSVTCSKGTAQSPRLGDCIKFALE
jgi:hypothetical protein